MVADLKNKSNINLKNTGNYNKNYKNIDFDKIKNLRPSLREKHRYIKYKVILNDNLDESDKNSKLKEFKENCVKNDKFNLNTFVLKELNLILGVFDSARAGLVSIRSDYDMTGIIRCSAKSLETVKFGLNLISEIEINRKKYSVTINLVRVGGTLKSMNKKILESNL